jgi:hypothetical protein
MRYEKLAANYQVVNAPLINWTKWQEDIDEGPLLPHAGA